MDKSWVFKITPSCLLLWRPSLIVFVSQLILCRFGRYAVCTFVDCRYIHTYIPSYFLIFIILHHISSYLSDSFIFPHIYQTPATIFPHIYHTPSYFLIFIILHHISSFNIFHLSFSYSIIFSSYLLISSLFYSNSTIRNPHIPSYFITFHRIFSCFL